MTRFADLNRTPLEQRTVTAVLEAAVRNNPDKVAIREPSRHVTYGGLWDAARRLAGGFRSAGVRRADRVILMLDNHADNVLAWIALTLLGAVEVPINTGYKGEILAHVVNDSGATLAVIEDSYLTRVNDISRELRNLKTIAVRTSAAEAVLPHSTAFTRVLFFSEMTQSPMASPELIEPWDLAAVVYTSGTTGRSKGVLCPHAHAWGHGSGVGTTEPEDTRLVVLPQFHITGQWGGVYRAFMAEATAYIPPRFRAQSFWEEVRAVGATTTQLVGTMASFISRLPPTPRDGDNPLREVYMIPTLPNVAAFAERFGVSVYTQYGTTETGGILVNPDAVSTPGMGSPVPGYDVRLVDEYDVEVAVGRTGEIVVRADVPWTSMLGYQGLPDKTAEALRNGWLHSGDAAYKDEEGHFFFVDRIKDAIRRRGENVSSAEVEYHIDQYPGVAESAVVAVPSEHLEDEIKAVVVPSAAANGSLTERDLFMFLADRLPFFMVPRYIEFCLELPKTPTAKVRKADLRAAGTARAWDCQEHGLTITRNGISTPP